MRPRKRVFIAIENEEIACHVRMLLRQGVLYKLADGRAQTVAHVEGLDSFAVAISRTDGEKHRIIIPYDDEFPAAFLSALEIACIQKRGPKRMPDRPYARAIGARAGERYAREESA